MNASVDSLIDLWGQLLGTDTWPVLARPEALWLLVLPLGLALWRRQRRARLDAYADPELHDWAFAGTTGRQRRRGLPWVGRLLWALFWLFAVLALADPRVPEESQSPQESRAPLLFVVDGSSAMSGRDVEPNRIERAVMLIELLGESISAHPTGLLRSVDTAGLMLPPSPDGNLLTFYAQHLPGLVSDHLVARPDRAFELAAEMSAMDGGAVIWLTAADGRQFAGERGSRLLAAAKRLAERDIPLFAVAMARERTPLFRDGQPRRNDDNEVIVSEPDVTRVAELASLTDGVARQTGVLAEDAAFLRERIDALPAPSRSLESVEGYRSLAVLALWVAMVALVIHLVLDWGLPGARRWRLAAIVLVAVLAPVVFTVAGAAPLVDEVEREAHLDQAWQAFEAGEFARAQIEFDRAAGFNARLGSGLAAFRRADYPHAVERLQAATWLAETDEQRLLALFNLGNALTLARRYRGAVDAFEAALRIDPEFEDARTNRDLVEALRGGAQEESLEPTPEFQGYESILRREIVEDDGAEMAEEMLESEGSGQGGAVAEQPPGDGESFVLDENLLGGARKKLERIEDRPVPPLDGLLRQQPYKSTVRQGLVDREPGGDE
ncbi:tetratricopeptide repeat protein [Guyparkeria halophila]|uniref:Tetratricopeptide repeat protein n=1 Tax=Guyparkeria halophila TaxID=47960 RepID=A0A6I6D3L9_9GAMM|nr:tetratricopeptide repeat protein [Guyparkeria halophila]QGT79428.1 tetratricopeptide repeat protein [Guyparkeria halophila]